MIDNNIAPQLGAVSDLIIDFNVVSHKVLYLFLESPGRQAERFISGLLDDTHVVFPFLVDCGSISLHYRRFF